MLRDGLRREFPGASAWVARARRRVPVPRVARSGTAWAILAGLGADSLVRALLGGLAGVTFGLVDAPRDWQAFWALRSGTIAFAAVAAGAAVALRSGGWRALVGFAGSLALVDLIGVALAAPGLALLCERVRGVQQLDICAARGPFAELAARWPAIAGLATGLFLAARLGLGRRGTNAVLEAAGVVFALEPVARAITVPLLPPPGAAATTDFLIAISVLHGAAALLAGHLLVRRGGAIWPTAVVVPAVLFVAPWLPGVILYARFPQSTPPPEYAWATLVPAGYALALLLAATLTAAFARPRPPDADAARRGAR